MDFYLNLITFLPDLQVCLVNSEDVSKLQSLINSYPSSEVFSVFFDSENKFINELSLTNLTYYPFSILFNREFHAIWSGNPLDNEISEFLAQAAEQK